MDVEMGTLIAMGGVSLSTICLQDTSISKHIVRWGIVTCTENGS